MKYRVWYNTRTQDSKISWVVQAQNDPNYLLAPSVELMVPGKFVTALDHTPAGWFECVGSLSVDGTTNAIVIR